MLHLRIGSFSGIEGRSLRDLFTAKKLKQARAKITRAPKAEGLGDWIASADSKTLSVVGFDAPAFAVARAMHLGEDPRAALKILVEESRIVLSALDENPASMLLVSVSGAYGDVQHFCDLLVARTSLTLTPAKRSKMPWLDSVLHLDAAQRIVSENTEVIELFDELCASAALNGDYEPSADDILTALENKRAVDGQQLEGLEALSGMAAQLGSGDIAPPKVIKALSAFEKSQAQSVSGLASRRTELARHLDALALERNAALEAKAEAEGEATAEPDEHRSALDDILTDALDVALADVERIEQERELLQDSLLACSLEQPSTSAGGKQSMVSAASAPAQSLETAGTGVMVQEAPNAVELSGETTRRLGFVRAARDYVLVRRSKLFDAEWYVAYYPDLADVKDPARHFVMHGAAERRAASRFFSCHGYTEAYSDVNASDWNPLVHYILVGRKEGRRIFPVMDASGRVV